MPDIGQLLGITAGKTLSALPGLFNQLAQQNIGGPEGYAQQQENQRQQQLLAQQLQLHNSLSADQQSQIDLQQNAQDRLQKQTDQAQALSLMNLLTSGKVQQVQEGTPGAVQVSGRTLAPIPDAEQAGMFNYKPSDSDVKNYPWLASAQKSGLTIPVKEFPTFLSDMSKLQKAAPGASVEYGKVLQNQLNSLVDDNDPMKPVYKSMIQDAIMPADGSAPDHKRALMILDDIRKSKQSILDEQRKQQLQFSPTAISGAASKAGVEESARQDAAYQSSVRNLPDQTLKYWYDQIKRGATSYNDVLSRFDKTGKERMANFVAGLGDPLPIAMSSTALSNISQLDPVLTSLKNLKAQLDATGLSKDTTPGSMAKGRLLYSLGVGDSSGGLISTGEMDRLRGAAKSLTGLRASLPTLEQAQIHTPNFWLDSGKLMSDKLDNMIGYLENAELAIEKYGAKSGIVQSSPDAGTHKPAVEHRRPIVIPPPPK